MGLFSERLETMIAAALRDGVLTDKERELLKKRVEKEGEDWDEVEMIINARLTEVKEETISPQKEESTIIEKTKSVDDLKKVTLVWCDCELNNYVQVLMHTLDMSALESMRIVENIESGKPYTLELDSPDTAKRLLTEIEKVGGTAHYGDPAPEDLVVKVYGNYPEDQNKSFIEVPEGVTEIKRFAFSGFCMEDIKLPSTLIKIDDMVFKECGGLEKVCIPENVEFIGSFAFWNATALKEIQILSKKVKQIKKNTFAGCRKLRSISFPNGMETIRFEDAGFYSRPNIYLPPSMKIVKGLDLCRRDVNIYCYSPKIEELKELCGEDASLYVLSEYLESYKSQAQAEGININIRPMPDEYLYFYDKNRLYMEDNMKQMNNSRVLIIPEGVTKIEQGDFNISNKEEIAFPSSIKEIGTWAFGESENLKLLDLSSSTQLEIIGDSAFQWCRKLETVILPSSLKKIGDYAFMECDSLKEVDFSRCDKLEKIGASVFSDCKNLSEMDLSHCTSLNSFYRRVLSGCDNIRIIDFSGCINLSLDYGEDVLDVPGKKLEKLILPAGQKVFNAMCIWDQFGYNVDISNCKNITSVGSFKEMKMKEVVFPDSIEIIGTDDDEDGPFCYCENLKTIVMPAALREIKPPLGKNLEQLKKIDFSKVKNLKTIPKELVSWGCDKLKELIIPIGVTEIEEDAFAEMDKLKRLFLPPTLESIGDLGQKSVSIYCFSPSLEELEPIVYGWDDDDDDEWDEEDLEDLDEDELEELKEERKPIKIHLFVLPQYLDSYIAQRKAERIPEDVLIIQEIPEEYRYYYDN